MFWNGTVAGPIRRFGVRAGELRQEVVVALCHRALEVLVDALAGGRRATGDQHLGVDAVEIHVGEPRFGIEGAGTDVRLVDVLLLVVLERPPCHVRQAHAGHLELILLHALDPLDPRVVAVSFREIAPEEPGREREMRIGRDQAVVHGPPPCGVRELVLAL